MFWSTENTFVMSAKLLKKSLEILEEDQPFSKKKHQLTKKRSCRQIKLQKELARLDRINSLKQTEKQSLQKIRNDLSRNKQNTDENVRRLLALSTNTVKLTDAEKIVKCAHKGRYKEVTLPPVEKESIFTEEDFRKFEKEYFNS